MKRRQARKILIRYAFGLEPIDRDTNELWLFAPIPIERVKRAIVCINRYLRRVNKELPRPKVINEDRDKWRWLEDF